MNDTPDQHDSAIARHLLSNCGHVARADRVLVLYDQRTKAIGETFASTARGMAARVDLLEAPEAPMHGVEPPAAIADAMSRADLIVGLTYMSLAHTNARRQACQRGARYLSMPEYSRDLLRDPSLMVDYRKQAPVVRRMADAFTAGRSARITTKLGTDIRLDIRDRIGNYCPGFVVNPGDLGSPPDIEANVSPVETASEGVVVVDGSIPCREIGKLTRPVVLHVSGGKIRRFESEDRRTLEILEKLFRDVGSDNAYVLAECGVGLNDKATLTGIMLTDEGAMGCMHFGFGSNATVGGLNAVPFHLDFCFTAATLKVDDNILIQDGAVLS